MIFKIWSLKLFEVVLGIKWGSSCQTPVSTTLPKALHQSPATGPGARQWPQDQQLSPLCPFLARNKILGVGGGQYGPRALPGWEETQGHHQSKCMAVHVPLYIHHLTWHHLIIMTEKMLKLKGSMQAKKKKKRNNAGNAVALLPLFLIDPYWCNMKDTDLSCVHAELMVRVDFSFFSKAA